MRKILLLVCTIFLLHPALAQDTNRIVAKVNNEIITLRDLETYVKLFAVEDDAPSSGMMSQALSNLIEENLILQKAKAEKMDVPAIMVEGKLKKVIENYDDRGKFEAFLASQGLNIIKVKERIKNDLLIRQAIDRFVNAEVFISPKEITDYYNTHIDQFRSEPRYICWIAKSNKKVFLERMSGDIKKDGFEPVREKYKEIFFKVESEAKDLKDDMSKVVTSLNEDEYRIKEIDGACYLIYLKTVVPPHNKFLAEVKDEIYERLWKEKFEGKFTKWIAGLRKEAIIKVYE